LAARAIDHERGQVGRHRALGGAGMSEEAEALKARTMSFALDVCRLIRELPREKNLDLRRNGSWQRRQPQLQ